MKPILFNTDMVRAILDGRKTVTRRVVKPHFRQGETGWQVITEKHSGKYVRIEYLDEWENETRYMSEPFRPGDILYVRETWGNYSYDNPETNSCYFMYRADFPDNAKGYWYETEHIHFCDFPRWRPSIHMPKEAARLFLRVTDVRAERLQKITIDDVRKEGVARENVRAGGCTCAWATEGCMDEPCSNRDAYELLCWVTPFQRLWDSTIKPADRETYGWSANPWVWVIEFERISREAALKGGDEG